MIVPEPDPEDLLSLVPCCKIEAIGLRVAACIILPLEAVGVAEVDGVG